MEQIIIIADPGLPIPVTGFFRPTLHGYRLQRFPRLIESRPQFGEGDAEQRMAAVAGHLGQRPQDKSMTGDFIAGELQAIFAQRQIVGRQPGANIPFRLDVAADADIDLGHVPQSRRPRSMVMPASRAPDGTPGLRRVNRSQGAPNSRSSSSAMRSPRVSTN